MSHHKFTQLKSATKDLTISVALKIVFDVFAIVHVDFDVFVVVVVADVVMVGGKLHYLVSLPSSPSR